MHYTMLSAKLHKACVTHAELDYDGSCAIDRELLDQAGIREYEQIHIYNITNGERFTTYAIAAQAGSGVISVNGAAAHKAQPGDRLIICSFVSLSEQQLADYQPTLIYLDEQNRIEKTANRIPAQVA